MKKLGIITAILLLAVSAFSQPNSRGTNRQKAQDHKSEASVRRTEHNPKSDVARRQTVQNHKSEATRRNTAGTYSSSPNLNNRPLKPNTFANNNSNSNKNRSSDFGRSSGNKTPAGVVRTKGGNHTKGVVKTDDRTVTRNTTARKGNGNRYNSKGTVKTSELRKNYVTPNRRNVRNTNRAATHHVPSRYKTAHHNYRVPGHTNVTWSDRMYREYRVLYPDFHHWYYPSGYRIVTVPTYRAYFHIGEVRNVYGRIHEIWYSWKTDEYYLYFGATYPYQDFTVILPGNQARRFNRYPELYFSGRYIWVTGLVSTYNGRPEIMVMRKHQVHLY